MKVSSIVLIIIGSLLLLLQFNSSMNNDVQYGSSLSGNLGTATGSYLLGIVGAILLIIGFTSKTKTKSKGRTTNKQ